MTNEQHPNAPVAEGLPSSADTTNPSVAQVAEPPPATGTEGGGGSAQHANQDGIPWARIHDAVNQINTAWDKGERRFDNVGPVILATMFEDDPGNTRRTNHTGHDILAQVLESTDLQVKPATLRRIVRVYQRDADLPPEIVQKLSLGHRVTLLSVKGAAAHLEAAREAVSSSLSRADLAAWIQQRLARANRVGRPAGCDCRSVIRTVNSFVHRKIRRLAVKDIQELTPVRQEEFKESLEKFKASIDELVLLHSDLSGNFNLRVNRPAASRRSRGEQIELQIQAKKAGIDLTGLELPAAASESGAQNT